MSNPAAIDHRPSAPVAVQGLSRVNGRERYVMGRIVQVLTTGPTQILVRMKADLPHPIVVIVRRTELADHVDLMTKMIEVAETTSDLTPAEFRHLTDAFVASRAAAQEILNLPLS